MLIILKYDFVTDFKNGNKMVTKTTGLLPTKIAVFLK